MKILFCKDIISYLESSEEAMQIPNRIQTTIDRIRQKKKYPYSKYPYKKRNHCIDQYNTLLCRGNANINKENIEIIMKTFNNEKTFPINSKQLIKKLFITSFKDENMFLGKQNSCIRNIALCLQRFFKYFMK